MPQVGKEVLDGPPRLFGYTLHCLDDWRLLCRARSVRSGAFALDITPCMQHVRVGHTAASEDQFLRGTLGDFDVFRKAWPMHFNGGSPYLSSGPYRFITLCCEQLEATPCKRPVPFDECRGFISDVVYAL